MEAISSNTAAQRFTPGTSVGDTDLSQSVSEQLLPTEMLLLLASLKSKGI